MGSTPEDLRGRVRLLSLRVAPKPSPRPRVNLPRAWSNGGLTCMDQLQSTLAGRLSRTS